MAAKAICKIDDCDKPVNCKGLCQMHYTRLQRHGDPLFTKTAAEGVGLKLLHSLVGHKGKECVIWPYSRNPQGYGQTYYCSEVMGAHRVMCILENGPPPTETHQAAHGCGNGRGGCINPDHLRWATPQENILDKFEMHGWVQPRDERGRITGIVRETVG